MWPIQHREARRRVSLPPFLFSGETLSRTWVSPSLHVPLFSSFRYFTFLTACTSPKACTILLRGPSKDLLNEIDRNLADAMSVARNVVFNPSLCPGGGATEMAISVELHKLARTMEGVEGVPVKAIAEALEVIPRTLVQNCGGNAMRVLTDLRVCFDSSPRRWAGSTSKLIFASHLFLAGSPRQRRELVRSRRRQRKGRRHEDLRPVRVGCRQDPDLEDCYRGSCCPLPELPRHFS
jgi:hypothetical protein